MIILDNNIRLKPITVNVVSDIFETIDKERKYLREWLPFVDETQKEDDILAFANGVLASKQLTTYTIHDERDTFWGLVGFNNMDIQNQKAEIGYWLSEKAQGRGIITNSVQALLKIGFTELNLNSIRINAAVDNLRSRKIPEKLGFTLEGIQRDGELLVDNRFTDIAVYSLLKNEFKAV